MTRIRLPPNPPKFDWKELTDNFAQQYTIYNIHTERKIITQVFLIHLDLALPQNGIESLATHALINCCCWLWRSVRFHFASCCMNGFHLCFCFVDTSWSWKPTLQRPINHYKFNFFYYSLTVLCLQFHQPVKKNCSIGFHTVALYDVFKCMNNFYESSCWDTLKLLFSSRLFVLQCKWHLLQ